MLQRFQVIANKILESPETFQQNIVGKITVLAHARIVYEKVNEKKIELGSQIAVKATIELLKDVNVIYSIVGGKYWAIIGVSRGGISSREKKLDIVVQGIGVRYGQAQIPQIKLEVIGERYELVIERSGDTQAIAICPRPIITAIPKPINLK